MKNKIGIAKITSPAVEGVYKRTTLFDQLSKMRDSPVIWVSAPAGSGKTTLLASYLDTIDLRNIWYKLDDGDADLSSFFYYLGLAIRQSVPRELDMPLLTPDYLAGLKTFIRNYFRRLFPVLELPAVLVLDNYQELPTTAILHELLIVVAEEVPPEFSIIILSRVGPPTVYSRLMANQALKMLDPSSLSLSYEETDRVCRLYNPKLPRPQIKAIQDTTQGWFAGITLLLQQSYFYQAENFPVSGETVQVVFDYFANEVFGRINTEIQTFLMQLAVLPEIHHEVAKELTGRVEAEQLLAELNKKNYFISLHRGIQMSYEFHPLFRQFLLDRLKSRFDQNYIHELQRMAAGLMSSIGQIEATVMLWRDVEEWFELIAIVRSEATNLLAQGRHRTLDLWINYLPDAILGENAWMMYWLGVSRFPFAPLEGRQFLERAYELFATQEDMVGAILAWSGVVDCYVYDWADMRPLDKWIEIMENRLLPHLEAVDLYTRSRATCSLFTALMYRQPTHPDFPDWVEKARDIVYTTVDPHMRLYVGTPLLLHDTWWEGDLVKARLLLEMLEPLTKVSELDPLLNITWQMMSAAFFWMDGETSKAVTCVDIGLNLAERSGVHAMDVMLYNQGLFATLSAGDLNNAEKYSHCVRQVLHSERYLDYGIYHYLQTWFFLLKGQLIDARRHSEKFMEYVELSGSPWFQAHAHNSYSVLRFLQGDSSAFELTRKIRLENQSLSGTFDYLSWLCEAEILLGQGNLPDGLNALKKCLAEASRYSFSNHAWWRPQVMVKVYATALLHNIEIDYVRKQIRKRRLLPVGLAREEKEVWPWALKIYTLGQFVVELDGKPLQFTGKAQKRPLDLLKLLVASGEQKVNAGLICDRLWPDADGDMAQQNLKTTLHRLRKLVGQESVLFQQNLMGLNPDLCWTDIDALKYLLKPVTRVDQSHGNSETLLRNVEKMFDLYRGPFLITEEVSWVILPREMLRDKFCRRVKEITSLLRRKRQVEEALQVYMRLIEVEPLQEDIYVEIMVCYKELNEPLEAIKTYQNLCRILKGQNPNTPSAEAEAIYRSLISNQV